MNNRTIASLLDHHVPRPGMWSPALRLALLAVALLAVVASFGVQTAAAAGGSAPVAAPQQAGDDADDDDDTQDGADAEDGDDTQDGAEADDGDEAQDGADGQDGEQVAPPEGENGNESFYILLGVFAFVVLTGIGIAFAVFGYIGSGR